MEYQYFGCVRVANHNLARYGKQYNVRENARIIERAVPVFRSLLSFSDEIIITLKPLRGDASGYYDPNLDEVEVDFRYGYAEGQTPIPLLSVVAHEIVHADQYFTGRLDSEWDHEQCEYSYSWNGQTKIIIPEDKYSSYILPWEQEAIEKQDALALIVCAELGL